MEISKEFEIPKGFEIALELKTLQDLLSLMRKLIFSVRIFKTQDISKGLEIP